MTAPSPKTSSQVDGLAYAFAPIHKRALGAAVGMVCGGLLFVVTAFHVLAQPTDAPPLGLLAQYFYGYSLTWPGALVGLLWGGFTGFVMGWFVAFVRNLAVTIAVFTFRTRAELRQTADFLDHI
jgi:hypothetical protein